MLKFVKIFLKKLNRAKNNTKDFEIYSESNTALSIESLLKKDNEIKKITPDFTGRMESVKQEIAEKFEKKKQI